jgi:hypothetical protein
LHTEKPSLSANNPVEQGLHDKFSFIPPLPSPYFPTLHLVGLLVFSFGQNVPAGHGWQLPLPSRLSLPGAYVPIEQDLLHPENFDGMLIEERPVIATGAKVPAKHSPKSSTPAIL